ncbi:MAG: transposase [Pseudomonadota bacterium]
MPRLPRLVVPGHPHHVTQRGNRREPVFFCDDDYRVYLDLLREWACKAETQIWAYCLMPNHVHLILTPRESDGLRGTLGETHRRYTRHINFREGWRGHLWQERFHSFPMDEDHLIACARYVALNPAAAGMVARARDWPWSSARAHLEGVSDGVTTLAPLSERIGDWSALLDGGMDEAMAKRLEMHLRTGRPLGSDAFIGALEKRLGKTVSPGKPGRPRKADKER